MLERASVCMKLISTRGPQGDEKRAQRIRVGRRAFHAQICSQAGDRCCGQGQGTGRAVLHGGGLCWYGASVWAPRRRCVAPRPNEKAAPSARGEGFLTAHAGSWSLATAAHGPMRCAYKASAERKQSGKHKTAGKVQMAARIHDIMISRRPVDIHVNEKNKRTHAVRASI